MHRYTIKWLNCRDEFEALAVVLGSWFMVAAPIQMEIMEPTSLVGVKYGVLEQQGKCQRLQCGT